MTLAFLALPAAERKVYIDEAAARRGLAPVIVEKDFWVSWLLGILFQSSFRDAIVFKGGTSLSKVFGVINRFSEDIDVSLAPAFIGLDEPEPTAVLSKAGGQIVGAGRSRSTHFTPSDAGRLAALYETPHSGVIPKDGRRTSRPRNVVAYGGLI